MARKGLIIVGAGVLFVALVTRTPSQPARNAVSASAASSAAVAAATLAPTAMPPPATSILSVTAIQRPDLAALTEAKVVKVVDGDTIHVLINDQDHALRYISVDTPETVAPGSPVQPYGPEATARNKELVEGKTVYLEKDVSETDKYGRLLRYVWVGEVMVNAELVRGGYATVGSYPPDTKYLSYFLQLQREARATGLGLWAAPTATPTAIVTTAASGANLRGGPGTNYPVVGSVKAGQALEIVGRNQAGDWLQLKNGAWIAAFLVQAAPAAQVVTAPEPPVQPTKAPAAVAPAAPPPAPPTPVPAPPQVQTNCDPSYPEVCIPSPPPDLDCPQIPFRRFRVVGSDPHRFDGDHDGIGCER